MKKLLFSLILIITLVGCSTINDVNNNSSKEAVEQRSYKSIAPKEADEQESYKSIAPKEADEFDYCFGRLNVTFRVIDTVEVKYE